MVIVFKKKTVVRTRVLSSPLTVGKKKGNLRVVVEFASFLVKRFELHTSYVSNDVESMVAIARQLKKIE